MGLGNPEISFGGRIQEGNGAFPSAPHLCQWVLSDWIKIYFSSQATILTEVT